MPVELSPLPEPGLSSVEASRIARVSSDLSAVFAPRIKVAAPQTIGDAIDVPLAV